MKCQTSVIETQVTKRVCRIEFANRRYGRGFATVGIVDGILSIVLESESLLSFYLGALKGRTARADRFRRTTQGIMVIGRSTIQPT